MLITTAPEGSNPRFAIAYRTGGERACSWRRVLASYASEAEAQAGAAHIARMGYRANVYPVALLDRIGLPIGWEAGAVDFEQDAITYGRDATHWRAAH